MRILFIDIDTLRPDHLGCYGYHRKTSPNIDRIAAQGLRFDICYAPDAPCLPSRSVLWEGGPFHTRGNLPRYLERLRATGRADHTDRLAKTHPDECRPIS